MKVSQQSRLLKHLLGKEVQRGGVNLVRSIALFFSPCQVVINGTSSDHFGRRKIVIRHRDSGCKL